MFLITIPLCLIAWLIIFCFWVHGGCHVNWPKVRAMAGALAFLALGIWIVCH